MGRSGFGGFEGAADRVYGGGGEGEQIGGELIALSHWLCLFGLVRLSSYRSLSPLHRTLCGCAPHTTQRKVLRSWRERNGSHAVKDWVRMHAFRESFAEQTYLMAVGSQHTLHTKT